MIGEYIFSALTLATIVVLLAFYGKYSKSRSPKGKESPYAAIWWVVLFVFGFALSMFGAVYKKSAGVNGFNYWMAIADALTATFKMFSFDFRSAVFSGLAADNMLYMIATVITFICCGLWTISMTVSLVFKGAFNEVILFFRSWMPWKKEHYILVGSGANFDIFLSNLSKSTSKRNITIITGKEKSEELYKKYLRKGYVAIGAAADESVLIRAGIKNKWRKTYVVALSDNDEENLAVAEIVTNAISRRAMKVCASKGTKLDEFLRDTLEITQGSDDKKKEIISNKLKKVLLKGRIMYTFIDRVEHFSFAENAFGLVDFFNPYELRARNFFWEHPITDRIKKHLDFGLARLKGSYVSEEIKVSKNGQEKKIIREKIVKHNGSDYKIKNIFIGFGAANYQMLKASVINDQLLGCDYNAVVFDSDIQADKPSQRQAMFLHHVPGLFGDDEAICGEKYFESPHEQYNIQFKNADVLSKDFYKSIVTEIKDNDSTAIYIALGDDKVGVETAMEIRQALAEHGVSLDDVHIFVKICNRTAISSENLINNFRNIPAQIECYGMSSDVLTMDNVIADRIDSLASVLSNQSHRMEWEFLHEFDRDSNRSKVLNTRVMLGFMGLGFTEVKEDAISATEEYERRYGLTDETVKSIVYTDYRANKPIRLKYLIKDATGEKAQDTARNNLARREHLRWDTFHLANGWTKKPISLVGGINGEDKISEYFKTERNTAHLGRKNLLTKQHACITTFEGLEQLRECQSKHGSSPEENYDTIYHDFTYLDKLTDRLKKNEEEKRKNAKHNKIESKYIITKTFERVGIITYDYKHLKTGQVLEGLIKKGKKNVEYVIFALPFTSKPQRKVIFQHRPNQFEDSLENTKDIAAKYGMKYIVCKSDLDISGCDYYLLCGAGILSPECVKDKKIVNCHPGVIPCVRGLDAFKWAIYNNKPVGNTLYFITAEVDLAEKGFVSITPVLKDDTFEIFAARHYGREIDMLVNYSDDKNWTSLISISLEEAKPTLPLINSRMKETQENELNERFETYKDTFGQKEVKL